MVLEPSLYVVAANGSGPGSRGYAAAYKNTVIRRVIQEDAIRTIFDIGCGDLCWLDNQIAQSCGYVGFDISEVVIAKNAAANPSLRFLVHDIAAAPIIGETADLVVSFDVLIHQIERATFLVALTNILAGARKLALVSYLTPPLADGSVPSLATFDPTNPDFATLEERFLGTLADLPSDYPTAKTAFHGPLPDFVASLGADFQTEPVGQYRRQTIYAIRSSPFLGPSATPRAI